LERLGTSYGKDQSGSLRNIPDESLNNLKKIFDETGATARFEKLEHCGRIHARQQGIEFDSGNTCDYFRKLYEE